MTGSAPFWIVFNLIVVVMLIVDLKLVHRHAHAVGTKEAALWSVFWIAVAVLFGIGIHFKLGHEKALQFFTGYVIEKSLSVDNLFVFLMIFTYFQVPDKYQPRVLHWGILGALVMRFILIFTGSALLNAFHWILYLFGAVLIVTGVKMAFGKEEKMEPEKNLALRLFRKFMPISMRGFPDDSFLVREAGRLHASPLLVALVVVESSDLIFAVDSIPAIFAVTTDPFIVYTSNVFAILGLRALYFVMSSIMPLFRYLKAGISIVLTYVGVKMIVGAFYKIPTLFSLGVIIAVLGASVLLSVLIPKQEGRS